MIEGSRWRYERAVPWLRRGDALWFPADLPHRYRAVEDARMVIVMSFPPAHGIPR